MKKIKTFIISFCFIFIFSTSIVLAASATEQNEVEPNNSPEQAQSIQKNHSNPSAIVNGDYTGQFATLGNINSKDDVDWYKVYLSADSKNILTVNSRELSGSGIFEIYDENLNLVLKVEHNQKMEMFSLSPYYISIQKSGYYYVKVSTASLVGNYRFTIGDPNYKLDRYTYTASRPCTLTSSIKSVQATYDLSNIASIPNNAIVYEVSIGGTEVNRTSDEYRSIKLENSNRWIPTTMYSYVKGR